eukprot:8856906-Prorocentrum_lima.AAC.1
MAAGLHVDVNYTSADMHVHIDPVSLSHVVPCVDHDVPCQHVGQKEACDLHIGIHSCSPTCLSGAQ